MSCSHPITALRLGVDDNGKQRIKIKRLPVDWSLADFKDRYGAERVLLLPCGHCDGCELDKRKEWMIRCLCEAKYYKENCFVTLTYNDDFCDGELHKEHFQEFIKNLRNKGFKVRYFACGEFGSTTFRPHMHAILFGFLPGDLHYLNDSQSGESMFESELVSSCWKYGFAVVQYFEPSCAGYVAGYTNKKALNRDGFLMTSRRPGLGYRYLIDNYEDIYKYGHVSEAISSSQKVGKISRYFDKIVEKENLVDLESIRHQRIDAVEQQRFWSYFTHHYDKDEDILHDFEYVNSIRINKLKRGL